MPVTATPIFAQAQNVGALNALVRTAMTNTKAFDGTEAVGTAMALVYTAGANGSRIDQIVCRFASTNGTTASGVSTATLVRFWINNNSVNTTATNNILLGEVAIPATTVASLGATALTPYFVSLPLGGLNIPAGFRIYGGLTVATGGTNISIAMSAFGGDY